LGAPRDVQRVCAHGRGDHIHNQRLDSDRAAKSPAEPAELSIPSSPTSGRTSKRSTHAWLAALAVSPSVALLGGLSLGAFCFSNSRCRCSASAMGAGWIGVSAFVKQAALRPRLQVLRRTRPCRRTSGYCPLWSWHPPLRIEERDGGAKAALLQSFADNGVRPVLRGRIKSNQFPEMGPALLGRAVNLKQQT